MSETQAAQAGFYEEPATIRMHRTMPFVPTLQASTRTARPAQDAHGRNRLQAWSVVMAAMSSVALALGVNQLPESKPGHWVPTAQAMPVQPAPSARTTPVPPTAHGFIVRADDAVSRRDVEALIAQAHADIDALRLTRPSGNNARDRFATVLRLDPGNVAARVGLYRIVVRYRELAQSAKVAGRASRADAYLRKANAVLSGSRRCDRPGQTGGDTLADVLRECP